MSAKGFCAAVLGNRRLTKEFRLSVEQSLVGAENRSPERVGAENRSPERKPEPGADLAANIPLWKREVREFFSGSLFRKSQIAPGPRSPRLSLHQKKILIIV